MEKLFSDPEHYSKCFSIYSKISSRLEKWSELMDLIFEEYLCDKLLHQHSPTSIDSFQTLGVGCSSGFVDYEIVSRWSKKYPRICNTVVEPFDDISEYKIRVERKKIPGVEWDWRQQKVEEYYQENIPRKERRKFHFISAISVLSYMKDWKASIMNMYEDLEKGGVLIVALNADDCASGKVWRSFPILTPTGGFNNLTNIEQVKEFLSEKGLTYDAVKQDNYVDVTDHFNDNNEETSCFIDFISHTKNFQQTAPQQLVQEFFEILKKHCIKESDRFFLNEASEAVIVQKCTT